jgi:hypothetical protein
LAFALAMVIKETLINKQKVAILFAAILFKEQSIM